MNVYVDQNFLINCANKPELYAAALKSSRVPGLHFVLSPWHFYEIGKSGTLRGDEIVEIAESLSPKWILDRSDLQVAEFREVWGQFYGFPRPPFLPIGELANMAAVLLRKPPDSLARFTLLDFVRVVMLHGARNIIPTLDQQQSIAAANQVSSRAGKITAEVKIRIQLAYCTLMLARMRETSSDADQLDAKIREVQSDSFMMNLLRHFQRQGEFDKLRAWNVESLITDLHHIGTAKLNHNRQLDRQHAVAALAYCDVFVTNDQELTRLCHAVAGAVPFRIAVVRSVEEFLSSGQTSR